MLVLAGCDVVFGLPPPATVDASGAADAGTSLALVQEVTEMAMSETMLEATLPADPIEGNVLLMVGAGPGWFLSTPRGGGVSTWTSAARSIANNNVEIWYGLVDGPNAPVVIAYPSGQGNADAMWMSLTEWSGLATTALYETGSGGNGSPDLATAGTVETLDAPDLLVFAVTGTGNISSVVTDGVAAGAGDGSWTPLKRINADSITQAAWYRVVPSAGPYMPQTMVASEWDAAVAAFRIAP